MKFVCAPTLDTDRLRLRSYQREDFEHFAKLYASPRSRFVDGPVSRSTAWSLFAAGAGRWPLVGYGGWAVDRLADHACVGIVSLNYPINQSEERELGWLLWESYEGNGYAVEAASAARKFAFEELGWAALVSYIATDNDRSIRLAERMGASKDHDATKRADPKTVVYRHHPKKCGSQK
ncbi:GNAT family N-acetyltransferase [Parasphingorhabdus sp.]|uniref:GNAT family N-acetyltransferase n=1 Tax=Parasphingorhabdus sp. TaxID=2709688 RepID=UPI003D2CC02A